MAKSSPSNVRHTCVDRIIPADYQPARSLMERAAHAHAASSMVLDPSAVVAARMAVITMKRWPAGFHLKCRFLDGDKKQRAKVRDHAAEWEDYANIKIDFVENGEAEVRIAFRPDDGCWSAIGTDALVASYFPKYQPTMNFGWLTAESAKKEDRRVVLHEFGHALGCIHEHQSPKAKLKWNKAEVYRYFAGPPNYWSKEDIDHNVLAHYGSKGTEATAFDEQSIMLYQFDGSLFTNGQGTRLNDELSDRDKAFIGTMYPKH